MPAARSSKRTIARAAREAGVGVETIRYYERIGLIARPRASSGYRDYPDDTVLRIRFIKTAQKFGFSLKEIEELTGMADSQVSCEAMCARVEEKLQQIDMKLMQLRLLREELSTLLRKSPRKGSFSNCEVYGTITGKIPR